MENCKDLPIKSYNTARDTNDVFKKRFKYYKLSKQNTFKDVIGVDDCCTGEVKRINIEAIEDSRAEFLGMKNIQNWVTFTFKKHPGLLLIQNPFTALGQRYWIRKCLEEYPKKPNKINIDIDRSLNDWWVECFDNEYCDRQLQKKLRWTTLGYHHNWDTKVYTEENRTTFPEDLAELSDIVARYLGYKNFRAEAAIVNYYHMDSTLSAHTDHSEVNLEAPLLSVSFGQSAIFLIGGEDKNTEPSAIMLNSGDIVVMSKEARLCYHAVPKVLPASSKPWNEKDSFKTVHSIQIILKYVSNKNEVLSLMNRNSDDSVWEPFKTYIEQSRINLNVRQVLNEKQSNLNSQFIDS